MKNNFKHLIFMLAMLGTAIVISCSDDDDNDPGNSEDPIASFQSAIDADDFLKVQFTSFSQNASTYSWDFDDNGATSTEENPIHTFSAEGTYNVSLTVTNDVDVSNTKTEVITISDPEAAARLLHGEVSKTWKLIREQDSVSMAQLGSAGFWAGNQNADGTRPCVYEQSFTFEASGNFIFDDAGMMWGEWAEFQGDDRQETCIDVSGGTFEVGGVDVSAWLSGTHTYEYDPASGDLTLNGVGAWLGVPALGTTSRHGTSLPASKTMSISIKEYPTEGYDVMTVAYDWSADNVFWEFKYASYYDSADEPAVQDGPPACSPHAPVAATEISHSFASNDAAEWKLMQVDATSASTIELGVDDPADASAAKVGQFNRTAAQFQELKFVLDPVNAIDFTNMTTISLEVYVPSSNTYADGGLNKNVVVGFAPTKCQAEWWNHLMQYEQQGLTENQWTTVTFNLADAPAWAAGTSTGLNPKGRNDLDMIFIQIGGGNHTNAGTFYVRNFSIK